MRSSCTKKLTPNCVLSEMLFGNLHIMLSTSISKKAFVTFAKFANCQFTSLIFAECHNLLQDLLKQ